jgi:hypothetical protein
VGHPDQLLKLKLYDNLPQRCRGNEIMGNPDIPNVQALLVEQRTQPTRISKHGYLSEYLAVVGSTFAAGERKESKYPRVGSPVKGKRSKRV